jgi:hypothetical protein
VEHGVTLYRTQELIFLYEEKKPRKLTWKPARRLNCGLRAWKIPVPNGDPSERSLEYAALRASTVTLPPVGAQTLAM